MSSFNTFQCTTQNNYHWFPQNIPAISELVPVYKTSMGAKILGINVWSYLAPRTHRTRLYNSGKSERLFPRSSILNQPSENEGLLSDRDYRASAFWLELYSGSPELPDDRLSWNALYIEEEERPPSDGIGRSVSRPLFPGRWDPQYFFKLSSYTLQVYGVPQEFDLLEDLKGDVGYIELAPGGSLFVLLRKDSNYPKDARYERGDVPLEKINSTKFFRGPRGTYCWGDRISIFGTVLEND